MQMPGGRFTVRAVSPNRMIRLFMSRVGPRGGPAPSAATPAAQPAQAPASDLIGWVEAAGGSISGVAVQRDDGGGFGLAAAQDVSAGSTLITLPGRCHLSYDAATDPRLLALIDQVPAELWGAKLALAVVAHRLQGDASPFSPYIRNLPLGVAGLPMFFSGDAVAALQYPPVTEQVKKRCRWLLGFTQQALAPVRGTERDPFGGADVDANALGWALAVVTSRAFRTRGPSQPATMLPLIDMANHSFEPNARVAPGPGGAMTMVALKPLVAGEPVLISYGALANDFLLLDYGFIVPGNPHETVQLRFDRGLIEAAKVVAGVGSTGGAPEDASTELAPLPAWQQKALADLSLTGEGANTEVSIRREGGGGKAAAAAGGEGPVEPRLLAAVRVLCAPSAAALSGRSVEQLGRWDAALAAPAAELAALRTLSGLCAIALSQFSGSLEEDAALLAGATAPSCSEAQPEAAAARQPEAQPLTADQRLAVRFRMEKKQLLLEALAALSQRIKELAPAGTGGGAASGGSAAKQAGGGSKRPKAKNGGKGFGS